MIKKLFLTFLILTLLSCGNESEKMVYKTTDGEFASLPGNFIADFPTKPYHSAIDNQIGLETFQIHVFRSTLGANKVFSIEYYDAPEHMIESMTDEQIYAQGVANFANKMSEAFKLEYQKPIEQHGLNGQYFVLNLRPNASNKKMRGHIQGKIFRKENRLYTVTYMGQNDQNVDTFMESFRLKNN